MRLAAAQSATSLKTGQTPAWHEHLATILDAQDPLTAVIHPYEYSSQRNEPEAELVAGLMRSLYGRLLPEQGDEPLDGTSLFRDSIGASTLQGAQSESDSEPNRDRPGGPMPARETGATIGRAAARRSAVSASPPSEALARSDHTEAAVLDRQGAGTVPEPQVQVRYGLP